MHNAGYKALGIDNQFVFLAARVLSNKLHDAVMGIKAFGIRGITITHPHKITIMKYLDVIDTTAKKIGAVNTILNQNGKLIGSNTDWIGVVDTLEQYTRLQGKSVALIGAGGAARAALYGLTLKNAKVTIFNRTKDHAEKLAKEFHCSFQSLSKLNNIINMDIILNVTPISKSKSIIPRNFLRKNHIVFDAVYSPYETSLLQEAKKKEATVIHGTEWLLYQGIVQFEIYTGKKAPKVAMRKAIMENIQI
jgi:shikimate dehydrogenase